LASRTRTKPCPFGIRFALALATRLESRMAAVFFPNGDRSRGETLSETRAAPGRLPIPNGHAVERAIWRACLPGHAPFGSAPRAFWGHPGGCGRVSEPSRHLGLRHPVPGGAAPKTDALPPAGLVGLAP
jgi:hypothetical protein